MAEMKTAGIKAVDALGNPCPIPVVKTKKVLDASAAGDVVEVHVDNEIAVQNLTKLARSRRFESRSEKVGEKHFVVRITVSGQAAAEKGMAGAPSQRPAEAGTSPLGSEESGMSSPGAVSSGAAVPGAVSSGAAVPGAVSSGAAAPGAAASGAAVPGAVSSGAAVPGAASSGAAAPGAAALGATLLGAAISEEEGLSYGVACCPDARDHSIVVISSATMGTGNDELGRVLMKGFIYALSQLETLPEKMLFYNGGVTLTTEGSESLEDLREMEAQGVEIYSCGTCLNYYGLSEKLKVGEVTNMYSIAEAMAGASKIIKP